MSSQLSESLSAVVDEEASMFETRRVLDELARDPELRERWHRYHLIGAALRREGEAVAHAGALARFWSGVDTAESAGASAADVAAQTVPESTAARRRRRGRATAVAVAASVALGIVVGLYPRDDVARDVSSALAGGEAPAVPTTYFGSPATPVAARAESRRVQVLPTESDLARMRAYMLHHAHHTALNQRTTGAVPFVKVAAFEGR